MRDGWEDVEELEGILDRVRDVASRLDDPAELLAEIRRVVMSPEPERPPQPDLLYVIARCATCGEAGDQAPVMITQQLSVLWPSLPAPPVDCVLQGHRQVHPHPTVWTCSRWPEGDKERAVELKREERGPYPDYPRGHPDLPRGLTAQERADIDACDADD